MNLEFPQKLHTYSTFRFIFGPGWTLQSWEGWIGQYPTKFFFSFSVLEEEVCRNSSLTEQFNIVFKTWQKPETQDEKWTKVKRTLSQSNNAKFNPELANVRVHSFNTILWLLPAQPNFHRLKSSTILVRWQFIYKPFTKSKQTMEMPTVTAI